MDQVEKSTYIKVKNALTYVGKLLSTAVLILLIIIGMFLIYYVIAARVVIKNPEYKPLFSLYNIATGSMEPNIKVDDVIVNIRVKSPESIKVGDVITFSSTSSISKGLTVTHRVINIIKNDDGSYEYVTKGDFNPSADSATAKYDDIIGKVAIKLPGVGKIQGFIATKMGWFIVVLLPALGVIIYDIIKIAKLVYNKKTVGKISNNAAQIDEVKANKQVDVTLEHLRKSDYLEELNKLKKFNEQG